MNKEFKKYVTDELLLIANNVTGEYTDKQVQQAKLELYNRGVDDKIIADIMEEKEEAFMRRLDAAARAEQARMDKRNERNRNISYKWWEMLFMFMFAPFYLFKSPPPSYIGNKIQRTLGCLFNLLPEYSIFLLR